MTYLGAKNKTAEEMKSVLKFDDVSDDDVHSGFERLLKSVNDSSQPYQLDIANRLFAEKSYKFLEQFLATALKHYNAEATNLDFIHKTREAQKIINDWVEKQTKDKIKNLIPDGFLSEVTRMVLVNAIYFKGRDI